MIIKWLSYSEMFVMMSEDNVISMSSDGVNWTVLTFHPLFRNIKPHIFSKLVLLCPYVLAGIKIPAHRDARVGIE